MLLNTKSVVVRLILFSFLQCGKLVMIQLTISSFTFTLSFGFAEYNIIVLSVNNLVDKTWWACL